MTTEATLSPEIEGKLLDIPGASWEEYCKNQLLDFAAWQQVRLTQLRAAATVAVEGMQKQIDGWQEDARRCAQTADDWRGRHRDAKETVAKLQFELTEARSDLTDCMNELDKARNQGHAGPTGGCGYCASCHDKSGPCVNRPVEFTPSWQFEKTTPEEAAIARDAWINCRGGKIALEEMAAEIDKLIEKRLPLAPTVAGMTIEERVDDIWSIYKPIGDCHERARMHMTQAVAEAMAEEADRGNSILRSAMEQEYERHAAELAQKEEQIVRERVTFIREAIENRNKIQADADAELAQERANWQARYDNSTTCQIASAKAWEATAESWRKRAEKAEAGLSQAVAAAYEKMARKIDELYYGDTANNIIKLVRQLAAKPQEACGACGKADCTEIHADESDITHDCRPGTYGTPQEDGPDLTQAPDMAAEPRHPMAVCTGAWPETKAWDAFWGIR